MKPIQKKLKHSFEKLMNVILCVTKKRIILQNFFTFLNINFAQEMQSDIISLFIKPLSNKQ